MYTGTLIKDLMAAVERAEQSARRKCQSEEVELRRMFELQIPWTQAERQPVFAGAA
jgi:hypothetical protein